MLNSFGKLVFIICSPCIAETPLCLAVSLCKPKCRELIISLAGGGAHLDFRNKKGQTALHVAVVAGNTEALKVGKVGLHGGLTLPSVVLSVNVAEFQNNCK